MKYPPKKMIKIAKHTDLSALETILSHAVCDWSTQQLREALTHHVILLACQNEIPAGFLCFSDQTDHYDILQLAVATPYQRQGIASALIQKMIAIISASAKNTPKIFLEVRNSNLAAIQLYQKMGFTLIGERKKYYRDGEDAMTLLRK